jgi:MFS family permease
VTPQRRYGWNYWRLWAATGLSNLGDGLGQTAYPLLAAALTRDPLLVAGFSAVLQLPWLLFALPSGALVDRINRQRGLVLAGTLRTVSVGTMGIATLLDTANLPLLYASAFALGTAETVYDTASSAVVPAVLPAQEGEDRAALLAGANGKLQATQVITQNFAGPPLAGFLFAVSSSMPFLVDATALACATLFVTTLRGNFQVERRARVAGRRRERPLRHEIREALRWLRSERLLRVLIVVVAFLGSLATAATSVLVLFAQDVLGLGATGFGTLIAVAAVGSFLGGLTAQRIEGRFGPGNALLGCVFVAGATFGVVGLSSSAVLVSLMLLVNGWSVLVWNVITTSLRQALTPPELLGRVTSVYFLLSWGGMPIGAALGGLLARAAGLRAPFLAVSLALVALGVCASPFLNNRTVRLAKVVAPRTEPSARVESGG